MITDHDRMRTVVLACSIAGVRIVGIERAEAPFGNDIEPGWWITAATLIVMNHIVDAATYSLGMLDGMANTLWMATLGMKATLNEGPRPMGR